MLGDILERTTGGRTCVLNMFWYVTRTCPFGPLLTRPDCLFLEKIRKTSLSSLAMLLAARWSLQSLLQAKVFGQWLDSDWCSATLAYQAYQAYHLLVVKRKPLTTVSLRKHGCWHEMLILTAPLNAQIWSVSPGLSGSSWWQVYKLGPTATVKSSI